MPITVPFLPLVHSREIDINVSRKDTFLCRGGFTRYCGGSDSQDSSLRIAPGHDPVPGEFLVEIFSSLELDTGIRGDRRVFAEAPQNDDIILVVVRDL